MKILITLGILAFLFPNYTSKSDYIFIPQIVQAQEVSMTETASTSIPDLINQYATKYGVSSIIMTKIINCENGGTPSTTLQSYIIKNGQREQSFGLVQIFLPAHPDITKEQAYDPDFSLNYLASNLSHGRGFLWSCFKSLKKEGKI